ncbi:BREX-1 system adenine-specific DNA-methyltransferase PglX [Paenibacillus sp. ACRSA]|uniref:BREX-1 system adenine-specific DNA-methyltransferase PglX n=1 Tax=Paenibacillus sp. ACRSA TaxID=2918211 RepID=UPI001EF5F073|nr:BREX-1 system adenine-specific DNA-methyltransferase PglX [Paenibacillus sp. ACRSA]MCG7380058.1 BREX-1 system adenine-specific DNA-methyltransferase PglX [Paenibacillus sp. ACRSA]
MNKTALKNFATNARKELIEKVKAKAFKIGITEENIKKAQFESSDAIYIAGKQLSAIEKKQREKLISRIKEIGYTQVIEEVSYTWFNRFTALRFMEVNNYLPTKVRVLSSSNAVSSEPDLIKEALTVDLDIDKELVYELKLNNKTEELFKYLIIKQCNSLNKVLPFMFETIDDYKEILFPEGLLAKDSFLREMTDTQVIPEQDWEQVEIIGWLYQFYISEKKDQVFADLKKNIKISKENIPAATQLFTPKWIVKYMVENSLGRVWLESNPESLMKSDWKYYVDEVEQEEEFISQLEEARSKNVNPENITFLDPCCGSGHILVYAFDILYTMYQEKGYTDLEIPKLILENNLFGLDIDDRAVQLASFALLMKAREKSRRIFNQGIRPNILAIQESNWLTDEMFDILVDSSAENSEISKQREELKYLRDTFIDAKEFGSILDVSPINVGFLEEAIIKLEDETSDDIFRVVLKQEILEKFPSILMQLKIIVRKYDVVCTNPPYMGGGGMNPKLSSYVKETYPNSKSDMSTVFMEKALHLCKMFGMVSMINIPVWMFLSSFERLREDLILNKTFVNMLHLGRGVFGSDFGTTAFVLLNSNVGHYRATYRKLFGNKGDVDSIEQKERWFFERMGEYRIKQESFLKIPSMPIAYWISERFNAVFSEGIPLSEVGEAKSGLQTGNNNYFLKYWHEVDKNNIGFNYKSLEEANQSGLKWFPHAKGGSYRKWYGNYDYVVNFKNNGYEIKNYEGFGVLRSPHLYFKDGITWSHTTNVSFGGRVLPKGFTFNVEAPTIFNVKDKYLLFGLLNTKITDYILAIINNTIHYLVGDMKQIPIMFPNNEETKAYVRSKVLDNISMCKVDWDSFEISWDFKRHPLLIYKENNINESQKKWSHFTEELFVQLKKNEEELNRVFIEVYGLQEDVSTEVSEESISIRKANSERDIKSFISYALGCMFGRFSLDEEGLILAGGKFDSNKYHTFAPDKDNILPILSSAYLEEDIVSRFIEFVKLTFGEEELIENLDYIAVTLGKKEGEIAKETIRRYILNDFFKDHTQVYKKRPIYWLFSSGKQKAFNCLIYMHRYDKSTLSRIRTDYLHELQVRMDAEKKTLLDVINGDGTTKEIANAKKELKSLDLKIDELRAYDEKLHHMADMQIEIDLDDGVTVNYAKFEGLLAPIK